VTLRPALLLALAVLAGPPPVRADDPPPDRLEKKPKPDAPPAPKPDEKPADAKAKPEKPKPDDAAPDEDPEKIRERIAKNAQTAEERLKQKDPGEATRKLQDDVLKDIDRLLDLARRPPPPSQNSDQSQQPPPTGGQQPKGGQQPQGGQGRGQGQSQQQAGGSRRQRREQQRRQQEQQARGNGQQPSGGQPQPQPQPQPGQGRAPQGGFNREPLRATGRPEGMPDVVKDVWGHLPESLRQEVDHYYRDRFMPRYRELLQQYYSRLAEKNRRPGGEP
jgi:hypothetical protein